MEKIVIEQVLTFEDKKLKSWKETYSTESEALNTYMELVAENINAFPKHEAWEENGCESGFLRLAVLRI